MINLKKTIRDLFTIDNCAALLWVPCCCGRGAAGRHKVCEKKIKRFDETKERLIMKDRQLMKACTSHFEL